jgi:lysozyme
MFLQKILWIGVLLGYMAIYTGCAPFNPTSNATVLNSAATNPGAPPPAPTAPTVNVPVPRPSSSANESVCATATTIPGLDVSDYDPGTQWPVVKNSSSFTFIKATEGVTFTNDLFAADWNNAKTAGLVRGAYHFFHPGDDPAQQARFFLSVMGNLNNNDLPPVLDWEVTDGVSSATQIENALIWLQAVETATGRIPIIYVDPSFWNALGNPQEFVRYPLYIANYDVNCPSVPAPWSRWTFWQTKTAPLPGIQSALVDLDVFNGSFAQLSEFLATGELP